MAWYPSPAVEEQPDLVVLLGVRAESAEPGYGWIEPAEEIPLMESVGLCRVRRFREKPDPEEAQVLLERGAVWNTLVFVGRVGVLLALIRLSQPGLYAPLALAAREAGMPAWPSALAAAYRAIPSLSFSRDVLEAGHPNLALLTVEGFLWSDWGEPTRVLATLERIGWHPAWAAPGQARGCNH